MKKESALTRRGERDPLAMLQQITSEMERFFDEGSWPPFRWPSLRARPLAEAAGWSPRIEVFEKDNRLVTTVDLPGMKKDDFKVEVSDGHLAVSGERKRESEEKKANVYRCEREYGSFYRAVPLPEGVELKDVKATFSDGVLEVSVPLPTIAQPSVRKVEIQEPARAAKTAA